MRKTVKRKNYYLDDVTNQQAQRVMVTKKENEKIFSSKIVTAVSKAEPFFEAEAYHDDYYDLNREKNSYCTAVIDPKVSKLRKSFSSLLK